MPQISLIPSAVSGAVGAAVIAAAVLIVAVLYVRHREHNATRRALGYAQKSLAGHVRTYPKTHLSAGVLAVVGVAILLGVGVAYALYHGGARFDPHRHQPIRLILPRAGGHLPAGAGNLSYFLPSVLDQQQSNACGSFASTEAVYAERRMRGELPPEPFSPWHTYWYAAGGRDDPTTLEQQRDSLQAHGIEGLSHWPVQGPPDELDPSYTTPDSRASLQYIYYGGQGAAGLRAIQTEIQAGLPVILLVDWRSEGLQSGQAVYDLSGSHSFYHFVVAWQVRSGGIMVRNSWGSSWGINGDALLTDGAVENDVLAAAVMQPGLPVPAWEPPPPPTPMATPRPRPTVTRIPTTRPRATATRAPTTRPTPAYKGVYLSLGTNLRKSPAGTILVGLSKGTRLRSLGLVSGGWVRVQLQVRGVWRVGWVPAYAVVKST